jgi:hypothetical protein
MTSDIDLSSLRHAELVALVWQLRQQVAEREQEIERLQRKLAEKSASSTTTESPRTPTTITSGDPVPGSQGDLLAQLEKIYPEGR